MACHKGNSQAGLILMHLLSGKEINPIQALNEYGCYRLGAVIFNLKKEGWLIQTRIERFTKSNGRKGHYAVYKLEDSLNV